MSPITCHVLDTRLGCPAADVSVGVFVQAEPDWLEIARGTTDADGRIKSFELGRPFGAGTYRVRFETQAYLERTNADVFFPVVDIVFVVEDSTEHFHIPLLLSPYGYSTYRGS